jgi:cellulose synthase (UDP-forming)
LHSDAGKSGDSEKDDVTGRLASQHDIPSPNNFGAAAAPARAPIVEPQPPAVKAEPSPESSRRTAIRQIKLGITRVTIVLAIVFTARYFYWRFTATVNPAARWFFYAFLIAETLNFIESLLFYVTTWSPTRHARPELLPGRTVDVFITTYDEPVELLRETVLCATAMRYPHKTYILDDGNRPEVKQLADVFGCEYLARTERTHAKAGNLNNALQHSSGEFIVTLDADHVPAPDLIDQIVGFFRDEKIGAVQTAQNFYNLDSFQHRINWRSRLGWQQQELFFNVIQPGKDRFNAAFFCGSPAMIRRSALNEVGGFATETITEDMHTGMRLQKKKYKLLYYNRTLALGLAPQTYVGFATQWQRWGHGCMQVMRAERPILGRGLSFGQRLCYFASVYFYWMSYQKLAYLLTPVIALLTGIFPLVTTPELFVRYFFPYFLLNLVASVLLQGGFRSYFRSEQFNVLKMHVLMRTPTGLFSKNARFKVTPKSRASAASATDLLLPLALCVLMVAAIVMGGIRLKYTNDDFQFWALAVNVFWSAFYVFMMTTVIWVAMRRKELRASYRFPANLDLRASMRFKKPNSNDYATVSGFARNLNRYGLSITSDAPINVGTAVEIELTLPNRKISASGEVVRHQNYKVKGIVRVANGIRFTSIEPKDQDGISEYLFGQIAPRENQALQLTHLHQEEE